jgi:hypothetical protein
VVPPSLITQTTYAELLERCASAAFGETFPAEGEFVSKTIKGRRYWYFQLPTGRGRAQQYAGPETPELLERIAQHKEARADERERHALVSTLVRSSGMPRPIPELGDVISALAKSGVFRLRGVLIGTMAYQTYSAMLGLRLPAATLQTGDIDIAQFKNVSVAIADQTSPMLDVLKAVDKTFRPVPHSSDRRRVTSYVAKGGIRVDFLTPNEGSDTDTPQLLPAFRTHAQPLRFLDFLIHEPEAAVILHKARVYAQVPSPQRYAVHKLIVSRRRPQGSAKSDKDLQQAEALLAALAQRRPHELKTVWNEASERGGRWRQLVKEGLSRLAIQTRDLTLKTIDLRRNELPGVTLVFRDEPVRHDFGRDVVTFTGADGGNRIECAVSRATLDDHFGTDGSDSRGRVEASRKHRTEIEGMARVKYLTWPIEEPASVLIKTADVPRLRKEMTAGQPN